MTRRSLLLLVVPLLVAGCPAQPDPCTPENQKKDVLGLMRSWYLFPDLLRSISPTDPTYPTVNEYLAALTADARAAGKDRGWTYATTVTQSQAYYDQGTSVGFGIGILVRQDAALAYHLFVSQVFPGSAAAGASFARGDEILSIGDTPQTLVAIPTLVAGATTIDAARALLANALGPSTAGVSRSFQVLPAGAATSVPRTMTKATYALDPVPYGPVLIPQGTGVPPVGYVALRTFIAPADALLQSAFLQLKAAGVQKVIVDLRYNGGGLVSTADLLANLLAADRAATDVMFNVQYNSLQASQNQTVAFAPVSQSIPANPAAATRVAFITTGASASASEIVPNVLEPYRTGNIALVGATTYGKPVGQAGFAFYQCDLAVYLVALRITNAENEGDYYQGLPDVPAPTVPPTPPAFSGPLCRAVDDLTHQTSDPLEASTAAALAWLNTGTCPPAPVGAVKLSGPTTALQAAGPVPDAYPEAIAPDEAQRNVRGLF